MVIPSGLGIVKAYLTYFKSSTFIQYSSVYPTFWLYLCCPVCVTFTSNSIIFCAVMFSYFIFKQKITVD